MLSHILNFDGSPLLQIDNIGTSKDVNNNRFGPGQRDVYLVHYVVGGKGYFNNIPICSGQGFLVSPEDYEYYYPDTDNPWEYVWVTSHDRKMAEIFKLYDAHPQTHIFDYSSTQIIKNIIPTLQKNHNKVFLPTEILEIYLQMLNSHISLNDISSGEYYFKYAKNYVSSHIYMPVQVKDLTDALGISQQYLYKIFIKNCGISPKQYINTMKIEKAKQLLMKTDMSVNEIANSVGYYDALSFSKFFSLQTGMSPKAYKTMHSLSSAVTSREDVYHIPNI